MTKQLDELKVGGGATGVSDSGPGPTGGTASLPASKKQGDSMPKLQDPNNPGQEETSTENNTAATGDMSAKNRASVAMKKSAASGSIKEDVKALFKDTEINEDLVAGVAALIEGVVEKCAVEIAVELEEEYTKALDEAYESAVLEVAESVDAFMDSTADRYIAENALAIEGGLRAELVESFMGGLKDLFEGHYVSLPEDSVDMVESLTARVAELEEQLNSTLVEANTLRKEKEQAAASTIVAEVSESLTVTQREKFTTLAQGVDYTDADQYRSRLVGLKESFFGAASITEEVAKPAGTSLTESVAAPAATTVDSSVSRYVAALNKKL